MRVWRLRSKIIFPLDSYIANVQKWAQLEDFCDSGIEYSWALISIIRIMIQVCKCRSIVVLLRLGLEHASKSHNTP